MKRCATIFMAVLAGTLCSLGTLNAQQASDFSVTDIEGDEHQLYAGFLNQEKVVVLGFFYAEAPMVDVLYPLLQAYAIEEWSASTPVHFLLMSHTDSHADLAEFAQDHNLVLPISGVDGGAPQAISSFIDGTFGTFYGYPMFVVIGPSGQVIFDPWGDNMEAIITAIDDAVKGFLESVSVHDAHTHDHKVYAVNEGIVVLLPADHKAASMTLYSIQGRSICDYRLTAGYNLLPPPSGSPGEGVQRGNNPLIYSIQSEGNHFSGKFFY